ncbi:glycine--tRNA ligase [Actinoplanes friuliensis]|jgi:glycyl-tRNA synthetase|uniref:Multifunctional fusion protein n=1 Tax=Actinoplanes friuliensis DSM 7358 TaxID=1246995 RepID=U5W3F8_9ACTN|nr:glycine--tRNA ligase [Actinoplanes friuliensis]AGZ43743.1 glycyl-tRNA ligase [Actinoplanes friuliensis DSM 7358]
MLTMQDALARLTAYWTDQGCLVVQPMNTEVGAGTWNPATFLRILGPEPWRVVYVEPSVRPDDSRYGENPNRLQTHTQLQVILKPDPGNPQELYLGSLTALGIDVAAHDVRFVEDNWASPALGAWGLGWEVWLDGLEITQFTYFQQAGGLNLEPPSVEITYGIERIIMALQGVTHFKDIEYAKGVSYGEVFGQAEYEMSRYYLDDADVATNRRLLELYAAEAQRMIDEGLPVPAHSYVLKCSQAFNVLDSRGAVSTADRAAEFGRMRRLAGDVARLWVARRDELGHPLGVVEPLPAAAAFETVVEGTAPRTLVFEIGTEEMPPSEARTARTQVQRELTERLAGTRLAHGDIRVHATPRRLIAVVDAVAAREEDHVRTVKGPKTTAPEKAIAGFARSQGVSVESLQTAEVNGVAHLVVEKHEAGRAAPAVLGDVLAKVAGSLRSAKNMRWNDPELAFTRPVRWLVALWGDEIVPVAVSALLAGRETRVLRTAAQPRVSVASAESFMETLAINGIVADADDRRELIVTGAQDLVWDSGKIDVAGESALIDQITYLVEQPTPLLGTFDERYLELPSAVLTTVMRKHQRYLPVRDADGALLPMFVTVANGLVDVELVRAGNEAVLRARYEDAAFFYRADRQLPLAAMRDKLSRLTFTDKLGSMADRAGRIAALAGALADGPSPTLERAAQLVKFDLGSQLVTEMTSLAGVMARDYALHAGETREVAQAVYEAELPRQTGDDLPVSLPGALLSLADRLDLVTGLAATVGLPTGSSDPFALRRAVLGLLAVHRAHPALSGISLTDALAAAAALQPVEVPGRVLVDTGEFLAKRLEQVLVEEGHPVDRVRAVLPHAGRPSFADLLLAQLGRLIADPRFLALAEAIQRSRRIVPDGTAASYDPSVLKEPAEVALHEAVVSVRGELDAATDLTHFTAVAGRITDPINTFFDDVFVMADDPAVRAARLGLLATIRDLGADLLDWPQLRL